MAGGGIEFRILGGLKAGGAEGALPLGAPKQRARSPCCCCGRNGRRERRADRGPVGRAVAPYGADLDSGLRVEAQVLTRRCADAGHGLPARGRPGAGRREAFRVLLSGRAEALRGAGRRGRREARGGARALARSGARGVPLRRLRAGEAGRLEELRLVALEERIERRPRARPPRRARRRARDARRRAPAPRAAPRRS